ncbi:hypothetical protein BLA29_014450 [Euroglyphus maynei]|uniref:Uncharacterized protein n=1 Tax=Euroglyphus maynei TaxID=6958 RepID=A0A1Y3ANQ5_EURMA|nr:hypothetical protein BLA29_014450 [Euroglyphus maynei]
MSSILISISMKISMQLSTKMKVKKLYNRRKNVSVKLQQNVNHFIVNQLLKNQVQR